MSKEKNTNENIQKTEEKKEKHSHSVIGKIAFIVFAVLLLFNSYQLFSLGNVVARVNQNNEKVIDEVGEMRGDTALFGQDLNEIRTFLLLPTKNYSFNKEQEQNTTESEENEQDNSTKSTLYAFLTSIADEQKAQDTVKMIESLAKDTTFISQLGELNLKGGTQEENDLGYTLKINDNAGPLFAITVEKKTNTLKIQSALEASKMSSKDLPELIKEIITYVQSKKESAIQLRDLMNTQKKTLLELPKDQAIAQILRERNIKLKTEPEEIDDTIVYFFQNKEEDNVASLALNKKDGSFLLEGKNYKTSAELISPLTEKLKTVDTSTAEQKMINERKKELETIFQEEAFKDLIKNNNLTISTTPREEYNKFIYDLKKPDGSVSFSFAIELSSGLYKILKDGKELDLYTVLGDDGSKKKP